MTHERQDSFAQSLQKVGTSGTASKGDVLRSEGDQSSHLIVLRTGLVAGIKQTAEGQQQIVALYFEGDIVDHEGFTLGASRSKAVALTSTAFCKVPHSRLRDLLASNPDHARDFWRYVAFHGALTHEWLLNLGRRSAYSRIAFFLCEIIQRTHASPGTERLACPWPLTQTDLADALGLSVVHVNRTLMNLRCEGVAHVSRGHLHVLDWHRLQKVAGFQPGYLLAGSRKDEFQPGKQTR